MQLFRRSLLVALLGALALPLVPLGVGDVAGQEGDAISLTMAVPNPSCFVFYPVYVAIAEGFYADRGIDLTVAAVDGSAAVLQAMAGGQAELGAPGPGPVLNARARGTDVVFFYNQYPKGVFGLVVPEDSDAQTPEDLQGQTIGVGTADGAEVSLARAIFSGLDWVEGTDYEFLPVGDGGQAAAAFERGEIVAYMAAVSDMAILNSVGVLVRNITPADYQYFIGNGYAASRAFIDENPDVITTIGQGVAWATEWAPDNKDQVLADCAEFNPQESENQELSSALFDASTAQIQPATEDDRWGYLPPEHWELIMQDLLDAGELEEPLDLTQAYTNEFVDDYQDFEQ
jgi:NitT/TauT family transport system substrate-binding protein